MMTRRHGATGSREQLVQMLMLTNGKKPCTYCERRALPSRQPSQTGQRLQENPEAPGRFELPNRGLAVLSDPLRLFAFGCIW